MGTRRRNPRGEGARLRDDIVRAAATILEDTANEDDVTLREIARRIGVTAPSIYRHFADRGEILLAVLADLFAELERDLDDAYRSTDDATGRLRVVAQAYVAFARRCPGRYGALFGRFRTDDVPAVTAPRAPQELRGAAAFTPLRAAVAHAAGVDPVSDEALGEMTLMWIALHGIATLTSSVPAFPWPADGDLVDRVVSRLTRTAQS